jgi:hypothetical protein
VSSSRVLYWGERTKGTKTNLFPSEMNCVTVRGINGRRGPARSARNGIGIAEKLTGHTENEEGRGRRTTLRCVVLMSAEEWSLRGLCTCVTFIINA